MEARVFRNLFLRWVLTFSVRGGIKLPTSVNVRHVLLARFSKNQVYIYFTWFHCTGRYELNKLTLLPMCGFIAQSVEHRTGIAEVMGSNPVEALTFFRLLLSNCLNWKIHCDDQTSLSKMRQDAKRRFRGMLGLGSVALEWIVKLS